ncbi:MAG: hypothetical protein PHX87_04400 [Candidatus Peribacteraceae bacterium]|nr:hypothetical protein [Candidatus Peribacteraceae bacterium]MDD5742639.1 hypothetical protein [Candidatus Peribacteraceae bacterium]
MAEAFFRQLSQAIGRIEPWREGHQFVSLTDSFGRPVCRVSVHTVPNGQTARVDVLLHGRDSSLAHLRALHPALRDRGGEQVSGTWQTAAGPPCCRFTVPRDRSVTLELSAPEPVRETHAAAPVDRARLDELERIQECLERKDRRRV